MSAIPRRAVCRLGPGPLCRPGFALLQCSTRWFIGASSTSSALHFHEPIVHRLPCRRTRTETNPSSLDDMRSVKNIWRSCTSCFQAEVFGCWSADTFRPIPSVPIVSLLARVISPTQRPLEPAASERWLANSPCWQKW